MRTRSRVSVLCAATAAVAAATLVTRTARAYAPEQFLTGQDFAVAIDAIQNYYIDNNPGAFKMYPDGEPPVAAIDGITTGGNKYLNFGRQGAGFIITPGAASVVQSFQISSANDAPERDPANYVLMGTNNALASTDRSNGLGEAWTLIQTGTIAMPTARNTAGPTVDITNSTPYASYKMYFTGLRNVTAANSVQFSDIQFFSAPAGGGSAILAPDNDIRAIDNPQSESAHNTTEGSGNALDQNPNTKYLNLMNGAAGNDTNHGAGLVFTPKRGPSVVHSLQITTANDTETRDPANYIIYGTNDPLGAANLVDNGDGNGGENWTQIASGSLTLPAGRLTQIPAIPITNSNSYTSYKVVFDGTKGSSNMQIADISFIGDLSGATEWMTNASGDWFNGQNWFGPTPNGVGDTARFLNKSTAPHTVFADSAVTVGTLRIENNATYLLTGAGSLTVQVGSGAGSVNVSGATHEINLPLYFASDASLTVGSGATLRVSDPMTIRANKTVTKSGNVSIEAPLTIEAGGALVTAAGRLNLAGAPSFGAGARLDVRQSGVVINDPTGDNLATVRSQIMAGYHGGDWAGDAITSSTAAADPKRLAVGYATASDAFGAAGGTFFGQPVSGSTVLVRSTLAGDNNLSGNVDLSDFTFLAANFNKSSGASWVQGDYNYDGKVDLTDFTMLAGNFNQALPPDAGLGTTVPEPMSLGAIGIGSLAMMSRRGRRRRKAGAIAAAGALLAVPVTAAYGVGTVVNFHIANNGAAGPPTNANILYVGQGAVADAGDNVWNGVGPGFNSGGNGANTTSSGAASPVTMALSNGVTYNGGLGFDGPDGNGGNSHQGTPFFVLGNCTLVNSNNVGIGTATAPTGQFTLNNVPSATYDLYLYGSNYDGDRGAIFSVSSGTADSGTFGTVNNGSTNNNTFTQGVNYVVFHNVTPSNGLITGTWAPNPASTLQGEGNFNALQLVAPTVIVVEPEWGIDSAGNWNTASNWIGGVPNGVGAVAKMLTKSHASHTVFTDAPVVLGTLRMENGATYNIGGLGSLTMQVSTGVASINVSGGVQQKINIPLTFLSSTNIAVAGGSTLTIGDPTTIKANQAVTKDGNVQVQAALSLEAGASLVLNSGPTGLFGAPTLGAGAKVDVKNTAVVVEYGGLSSPAATLRSQIIAGRNGGNWSGANGINSSTAAANPGKFGVGYAESTQALGPSPTTWEGQPVSKTAVLVRYTLLGDGNLDKTVDLTDFTFLAANFNGTGKNWIQGDYNYDGTVDLTDFTFLAGNFNSTVPAADLGGAVPEPASLAMLLAAGAGLSAGRTWRRRRNG